MTNNGMVIEVQRTSNPLNVLALIDRSRLLDISSEIISAVPNESAGRVRIFSLFNDND